MHRSVNKAAALTLAAALTAVLALTAPPALAQRPFPSLLGVRVWDSTWKDVLKKYGQPTRVEVGASAGTSGQTGSPTGAMGGGGGPMGLAPGAGLPGLPGMGPGGGPGGGKMGSMAAMGMGGYSRMMMQQGMGARSGMSAPGMMPGGGMELGEPGAPGGFGMPGMGRPGGPGGFATGAPGGAGEGEQAYGPEDEVTWVYEHGNKKSPNVDLFLFNRTGRLIQIQSFGYVNGAITSRGIKLGDPVVRSSMSMDGPAI